MESVMIHEENDVNKYGSLSANNVNIDMNMNMNINTINNKEEESMRVLTSKHPSKPRERPLMSPMSISAILSTAFTYGCIMTTLFLLVLPIECQRIESESMQYYSFTVTKSIALGAFAAIAGLAQLVTPLVGLLSDCYDPDKMASASSSSSNSNRNSNSSGIKKLGKRLPYLILGVMLMVFGLLGQLYSSMPVHKVALVENPTIIYNNNGQEVAPQTEILAGAWVQYTIFYTLQMIGINIAYTIMIAFIPDYIPHSQTGAANGTLALMVVLGSLFGFAMFHLVLGQRIIAMYKLYVAVAVTSGIVTYLYICERERLIADIDDDDDHDDDDHDDDDHDDGELERHEADADDKDIAKMPSIHELAHALLYEPIMNKTQAEILSAFWIDISQHKDFFVVTISRFFYYMGISTQTFFLYFIHDALKQTQNIANPEAAVALLAIVGQSAGAITCYPIGIISDQYFNSRRKPFVYVACVCLGLGNLGLVFCTEFRQMMWVVALLGAANGVYLTMDTSLAVDTLEPDVKSDAEADVNVDPNADVNAAAYLETKNEDDHVHDHKDTAQLLGVWGVFGFIGSATGPLAGGIILLVFGRKGADSEQFYSLKGYEYLFSLTAFYFLCSAVSLAFVQKKGV
jgi:hypothetical protein